MSRHQMTRIVLVACFSLLIAGCLSTKKPVSQQIFRLNGCTVAADESGAAHGDNGPVIRVDAVRGPASMHDTSIVYQLDYSSGDTQSVYGRARWAEPPAEMLTADLRASLAGHGPWRAVVGPDVDARADWTLSVTADRLLHVFTTPKQSHAALAASLLVVDSSGKILAQREINHSVPADGADAAAGVAAMSRAETALCTDARNLLQQVYRERWSNDSK